MITIREAQSGEFNTIRDIAKKTWPSTYGGIISGGQIEYMLDLFYSAEALNLDSTEKSHIFLVLNYDNADVGFAAIEHQYHHEAVTRIHKIYLLPEFQGKGLGKTLLQNIEDQASDSGSRKISLNVNRNNKALSFYQNMGFMICGTEDIPIGNDYLMNDYKMEKPLPQP